jgi:hypothetical protein
MQDNKAAIHRQKHQELEHKVSAIIFIINRFKKVSGDILPK